MKILFFIESLRSGGKERRLVELIKGLKKYPEIECELILTRKDFHYKDILSTGVKIHYIVRKYLKKDPRLFFLFYKITKKYHPDIIHVWGNMVAIYAFPTKVLLKIPMINNQITDAPNNVSEGLLSHKSTFPFSDLIIANSKAGLNAYNAPIKKSKVIYNGFNFDRIKQLEDKDEIRRKFEINTKYVIGMVASFSDLKDYKTYLQAALHILIVRDDITFLCVGSGDDRSYRQMIPLNFKSKIKFLGRQENVESIMNICDIGVLSTYTEGISNAIMEFMALGKPVIATNGGGTPEIVLNGKTGFLVKSQSFEDLASKIEYLLENEEIATSMGEKGRKRIKNEFSLEKMTNSFVSLYKGLLN